MESGPQVSEHFGPIGELFLGLCGLFFLLSLHAPFRHWLHGAAKSSVCLARRYYLVADARVPGMHRWTQAFFIIFRARRELLLIVLAVVAFDYLSGAYDGAIRRFLINPKIETLTYASPDVQRLLTLHYYSNYAIELIGYTLFGWLAMMRAHGVKFERAARFSPSSAVSAVFACVIGADLIATNFSPGLLRIATNLTAEHIYFVAGVVAIGVVLYAIGAIFVTKRFGRGSYAAAAVAIVGFIFLTHLNQWLLWLGGPNFVDQVLLFRAVRSMSNFAYTVLWDLVFIAFVVVLAAPQQSQPTKQ